jgi:dihydroorotase/N-acyl-D-amino-acid deacylase
MHMHNPRPVGIRSPTARGAMTRAMRACAIALLVASSAPGATPPGFDLVIANGRIIDGTGSPWYAADVGIRDGRIAAIGALDAAPRNRIRQDLLTPSSAWDNEWQEIPGPEAVLIGAVFDPELKQFQGQRLSDVARAWDKDPMEALFDFLIEDEGLTSNAVFAMSEDDVRLALQQPWVSVNNDSPGTSPEGILGAQHPHPRAYGAFPRILRRYVREERALTLEDAIRKFSALAAQRLRLSDRGVLKQGMWADVVVFDPERVRDRATFDAPNALSEGMDYVLVNGVPVIDAGQMTGARPGKILRGAGYQP